MIRDPSDGTVRENPDIAGQESVIAARSQTEGSGLLPASGLPLESQKPEHQAKLVKSRAWLKEYFQRKPEQK